MIHRNVFHSFGNSLIHVLHRMLLHAYLFDDFVTKPYFSASNAYANLHRRSHVQKERNSISSYRDPSMAVGFYMLFPIHNCISS